MSSSLLSIIMIFSICDVLCEKGSTGGNRENEFFVISSRHYLACIAQDITHYLVSMLTLSSSLLSIIMIFSISYMYMWMSCCLLLYHLQCSKYCNPTTVQYPLNAENSAAVLLATSWNLNTLWHCDMPVSTETVHALFLSGRGWLRSYYVFLSRLRY